MVYEDSGYLVTDTQSAEHEPVEIETAATIPPDTSIGVTVYQDTNDDGDAENEQTITIADGTNTYSLSGFSGDTSEIWIRIDLEATDQTETPVFDVFNSEIAFLWDEEVTAYSRPIVTDAESSFRRFGTGEVTSYVSPLAVSTDAGSDLNPRDKGWAIGGRIRATLVDGQPQYQRGESSTWSWLIDGPIPAEKYRLLREYLQYAGEAATLSLRGGRPTVREHPIDDWPVTSHIVKLVPGPDVYDTPGIWGVIVGGSDNSTIVAETGNGYRIDLEIVTLADLDEYESRAELLDDLQSPLSQLDL